MQHTHPEWLSSIEELVEDARNGRMFILSDDEDSENEGDLVIPASMITPEAINFMARYGHGLMCLAMTGEQVERLNLPLMSAQNHAPHKTAFTVSIEAREGVTTGISAADRARTVEAAIDLEATSRSIVTPGHIFPLVAQNGGVLVRAGHTEAGVDISRLAGLNPSAVICEIMNDDGTMARMPDLVKFAQTHGLKIGTIADLIAYRRRTEKLVSLVAEAPFESRWGSGFTLKVYASRIGYAEHIALVKGDITTDEPLLVRVHQSSFLADGLGDLNAVQRPGELEATIRMISDKGRGVIVIIRDVSPAGLSQTIQMRTGSESQKWTGELRHYGIGAQILQDLGVRSMILVSNQRRTIVGLDGYGITLAGHAPIPPVEL
ncbi:MAG: 3,4-dihydroxy-2-butanone-4-phosphate synthase [Proteobacteria bacterium]|nr:3,4-dihydroxy-2-butanone-4-phosphate synthase [Pseudomonadota bacterium]